MVEEEAEEKAKGAWEVEAFGATATEEVEEKGWEAVEEVE